MFGAPASTPFGSGGGFGQSSTAPAFGSPAPATGGGFGAPAPATTGLFGSSGMYVFVIVIVIV